MTFAPDSIQAARRLLLAHLPIPPLGIGVVGDDNHNRSGSSYHLGKSALRPDSYSIVESARDRDGLTDAAAAMDIGDFDITVNGKRHTLRTFSAWLVEQCQANTPDTRDVREVIYSLDGQAVHRWDRLRIRSTGDSSHRSHTHVSWFRDSEARDKTPVFTRYFTEIGLLEDDMTQDQFNTWMTEWAGSPVGKRALGIAVLGFDPGADPKTGSTWPGVSDATFAKTATSNGTVGAGTALGTLLQRQAAQTQVLSALATKDMVDEGAVASALAPLLIATLPQGHIIDQATLEAALRVVFASVGQ